LDEYGVYLYGGWNAKPLDKIYKIDLANEIKITE